MAGLPPRLRMSSQARERLVDAARGRRAADLVIRGGRILEVHTGQLLHADLGIQDGRICWHAPPRDGDANAEIEVDGAVLVPGLIEPHGHPDILYTPSALARAVALTGTTAVCADTAFLTLALDDADLISVLDGLSQASVKFFWALRGGLDGVASDEARRLGLPRLERLLSARSDVTSSGEMTTWPALLAHDQRLRSFVDVVLDQGLRVDGHAAGASAATLTAMLAAGIQSDHEAMSGADLAVRIEAGLWTMVRHSSLRPDGQALGAAIVERDLPTDRLMLTVDGPVPGDVAEGYVDTAVRRVMDAGLPPATAIRMATLQPATYLGLDGHLGSLAVGRCADILVVDDLAAFRPQSVFCDGQQIDGTSVTGGFERWESARSVVPLRRAPLTAALLADVCRSGPRVRFQGIVTRPATDKDANGSDTLVALVGAGGNWICGMTAVNLDVAALASTFTGSRDVLLIGHDLDQLLGCYAQVVDAGGGLATPGHFVGLPVLGTMSDMEVSALAGALGSLEQELDLPDDLPPLAYLLLFASLAVLPDIRVTPRGVLEVKTGTQLAPVHPLVALHGGA